MDLSRLNAERLIQNLQTGVVVHSPDTGILYANPAALNILRLTKEQALGRDSFDSKWKLLDEFRQPLQSSQYPVSVVIKTQKPLMNLEIGICDSSSDEITWVLCNAYPEFDEQNNIAEIVVTFIDITHQKQAIPD